MRLFLENAIGDCPICGEDMEHCCDDRDDGEYSDSYNCWTCDVSVTYISPDDGRGEYHLYHDGEIRVELEPIGFSKPGT